MVNKLDKKSIETLVQDLINGETDVNLLNLAKSNQREAFLQALKKRPNLLSKVKGVNEKHFFQFAINSNYEYFIYLKREQYREEWAQTYLAHRLEPKPVDKNNTQAENKTQKLVVQKSMDNKIVFQYNYVTAEGDELYYFDKELQVPTSIKSGIKLSLKLVDALALIDKLDLHITQLGENKIKTTISDLISINYKAYLNAYIQEKQVGYYTLCISLTDIEESFKKYLGGILEEYGLEVKEFVVKKLAIPKDIQYRIEDQAFHIRQRRVDIEADAELAKKSLENYAAKLALQQKYPNAGNSLTEYEKDLALKRYLIKTGRMEEEEIDHSIKLQQKSEQADSAITKAKDIVPEIAPKKNVFKTRFITFAIICVLFSLIMWANVGVGVGLLLLGITVALFGTIAAFNKERFATVRTEITNEEVENYGKHE